jgi:O-methyltransferase involved in polyketide biosynthesis
LERTVTTELVDAQLVINFRVILIGLSDCARRLRRHVVGGDVDQRSWSTAVCGDERYCWVLLEGVIDQGLVSQNTEPQ